MKYQAIYKCRLCGQQFVIAGSSMSEKKAKKFLRKMKYRSFLDYEIFGVEESFEIHECKNGNIGYADFQGFKVVEE